MALLIKNGANISLVENDGNTPLHFAARSGFNQIVLMLIESGADIDAINNKSRTALHESAGKCIFEKTKFN